VDNVIQIVTTVVQLIMIPVAGYIAIMVTRAHRRTALTEFKIIALVHAIQSDIAKNGFTKSYDKKLNELLDEYDFVNKFFPSASSGLK
jgi:hypothetical protein